MIWGSSPCARWATSASEVTATPCWRGCAKKLYTFPISASTTLYSYKFIVLHTYILDASPQNYFRSLMQTCQSYGAGGCINWRNLNQTLTWKNVPRPKRALRLRRCPRGRGVPARVDVVLRHGGCPLWPFQLVKLASKWTSSSSFKNDVFIGTRNEMVHGVTHELCKMFRPEQGEHFDMDFVRKSGKKAATSTIKTVLLPTTEYGSAVQE